MRHGVKTDYLIKLYTREHLTLQQIGDRVGMTRQAVHKRLKTQGIAAKDGEHCNVICHFCGKEFMKTRSHTRRSIKHYCSQDCYAANLENPNSYLCRNGQRLARRIVNLHTKLPDGCVVHHKDGNDHNNDIANLCIFASQAEHIKHHRTGKALPVWDGSTMVFN